jgi:hypothetical protein
VDSPGVPTLRGLANKGMIELAKTADAFQIASHPIHITTSHTVHCGLKRFRAYARCQARSTHVILEFKSAVWSKLRLDPLDARALLCKCICARIWLLSVPAMFVQKL